MIILIFKEHIDQHSDILINFQKLHIWHCVAVTTFHIRFQV